MCEALLCLRWSCRFISVVCSAKEKTTHVLEVYILYSPKIYIKPISTLSEYIEKKHVLHVCVQIYLFILTCVCACVRAYLRVCVCVRF